MGLKLSHWQGDTEYSNQDWHVLATGSSSMHSGVLIMLAKAKFPQAIIRKEVPVPGRVLAARVQQGSTVLSLVNVYQKVWNGQQEAKAEREKVLDAIQRQIQLAPARYPLILAGDFNAAVAHQPPCTGSAVMHSGNASEAPDVHRLHSLMRQFDLRALNTFHPQPRKHTYTHHSGETSQIDYVIVRARSADGTAKQPIILHEARLAQWKTGSVHHPVLASIKCRFRYGHQTQHDAEKVGFKSLKHNLAREVDVQRFIDVVEPQLANMEEWDTHSINTVLEVAAKQHLVSRVAPVARAGHPAEQPVKQMWQIHKLLIQARQQGLPHEDVQRLQNQFKLAQKQVRLASKERRRRYMEDQLRQATVAQGRGDVRTLHRIINSIAPKTTRARPQIRDKQGRMTTPEKELRIIQSYWQQVYSSDQRVAVAPIGPVHVDGELLRVMLAKLPAYKALPSHYVPSVAWKLVSVPLADLLNRTVLEAWRQGRVDIPQEWRDAWLALLLKPQKQGKCPSEYRPIGLADPIGKTVLGTLRRQYGSELYAAIACLPQFAYAKYRGTAQALTRAFQHINQARTLLEAQKLTLSQRKAGARPAKLVGAMTVSIDLTKAFDSLEPQAMQAALGLSNLPPDIQSIIMRWRHELKYHVSHEGHSGQIDCQRGIRQGCKIAPSIWTLFTALVMHHTGQEWSKEHSAWYADDALFQVIFHDASQLHEALSANAKALHVIKCMGMIMSEPKCAVLLELKGTQAKKLRSKLLERRGRQDVFKYAESQWRLPVVSKHEYLGAVLSYSRPEDATIQKRVAAAKAAFDRLKTVLTSRSLALDLRTRLWTTCVVSSLLYAIPQVGLTKSGAAKLSAVFHKQLRQTYYPLSCTLRLCQQCRTETSKRLGRSHPRACLQERGFGRFLRGSGARLRRGSGARLRRGSGARFWRGSGARFWRGSGARFRRGSGARFEAVPVAPGPGAGKAFFRRQDKVTLMHYRRKMCKFSRCWRKLCPEQGLQRECRFSRRRGKLSKLFPGAGSIWKKNV